VVSLGLAGNKVALEGLQQSRVSGEDVIDIEYDDVADDDEDFEVEGMMRIETLCDLACPAQPMLDSGHVDFKGVDLFHYCDLELVHRWRIEPYASLRYACYK
jgi:hypothetical protein